MKPRDANDVLRDSGSDGLRETLDRAKRIKPMRAANKLAGPDICKGDLPDGNASERQDRAVPARDARLEVVSMADVAPVSIEWLWENRIAVGKVCVLAGNGGIGKSTLLCDWAARITMGGVWPDGAAAGPVGSVIIVASEDDLGDTIAPRLMAAGADLSRIHAVRSLVDKTNKRRGFSLRTDLEMLEIELQKHGDVRAVILDPVTSYLGKVDSHKNADVRAVLEPLGEMAARMRVAVICNNHFSKSGGSANNRIIGSVAFVNQARAAFIVTPDENDKTRRLLIPSKMNIGPDQNGLAYRIEGCLIAADGREIATSRIMYETAPVTISADQAVAAVDGNRENRSAKAEAIDFLTELLSGGPVPAKDIIKEASGAGISAKSLRSARNTLGIKPEKPGFESGWVWALPKMP
jgi:putative DNA primase/helicase